MRWPVVIAAILASSMSAQPAGVLPWSRTAGSDDTVRLEWVSLGTPAIPEIDAPLFHATRTALGNGSFPLTVPFRTIDHGLRAIRDPSQRLANRFPLQPEGLEPAAGHVNVYFGRDRTKWRERLPVYGAMRAADVLPGIDVEVSGSPGFHHYHVIVDDPALLQTVVFDFGSDSSAHAQAPISAWQERGGFRTEARAKWRLPGEPGRTMLHVDAAGADASLPLHLEFDWPRLRFDAHQLGETLEAGAVVAIDGDGSLYAAGHANARIVVQKFSAERTLVYTTWIAGGNPGRGALAIAADGEGGVWIAGSAAGDHFPGSAPNPCSNGCKPFVARLAGDGTLLSAAVVELPEPHVVTLDRKGMLYAAGEGRIEHPASAEPPQHALWVAKADPSKSGAAAILYATQLRLGVYPRALAIDDDGTILVGGSALPDGLAFPRKVPGDRKSGSAFLLRLDPRKRGVAAFAGARLLAARNYGEHYNSVQAIAVDAGGDIIAAGQTSGGAFEPGVVHHGPKANPVLAENVFVYRLGPDLDTVWVATLGGSADDWLRAMTIDAQRHIWLVGQTASLDFPLIASPVHESATSRLFAARLDASGRSVHASTIIGAIDKDPDRSSWQIAAAADGGLWIAADSLLALPEGGTIGVPERSGAELSLLRISGCRNCPAVKTAPVRKRPAITSETAKGTAGAKPKRTSWLAVTGGGAVIMLIVLLARKKKKAALASRPPVNRLRKR